MAKLEIPIKVDIYKIEELIDQLKHLQTYKLGAGDEMTLVDRDDVVEIIADHVKAEVSPPDQRWIPCKTELPNDDTEVIVSCTDDSGDNEISYVTTGWHYKGLWVVNNDRCYFVKAWQPLPAKPWEGRRTDD